MLVSCFIPANSRSFSEVFYLSQYEASCSSGMQVVTYWFSFSRFLVACCHAWLGNLQVFLTSTCRGGSMILVRGAKRSFDPRGGFPLKLPENCMILKKSWGATGGPAPWISWWHAYLVYRCQITLICLFVCGNGDVSICFSVFLQIGPVVVTHPTGRQSVNSRARVMWLCLFSHQNKKM